MRNNGYGTLCLYGIMAFGILVIFSKPLQPTWYDENYLLWIFLSAGPKGILLNYHVPNNHILYSLGLWVWRDIVGTDLLTSRLFSLALTALAIPGLIMAGFALGRREIGMLAAIIFCMSHIVGGFSAQLRGYGPSLGMLGLALGFATAWWRSGYQRSAAYGLPFGICGAIAIGILPTNLIFVGMISAWAVLSDRPNALRQRSTVLAIIALPMLGVATYAGVWRLALHWVAENHQFTTSYVEFLWEFVSGLFLYDQPWAIPLMVAGFVLTRVDQDARTFRLLALLSAMTLIVPLGFHAPPARTYIPLILPISLLTAWSLSCVYQHYAAKGVRPQKAVLPVLLIIFAAVGREAVLLWTQEDRWVQAGGAPQTLIDQYYNHPRFNPPEIIQALIAEPRRKIILTTKNVIRDFQILELAPERFGINELCLMKQNDLACLAHTTNNRPTGDTITLVIHVNMQMAAKALSGTFRLEDSVRWINLTEPAGYYNMWRIEGPTPLNQRR